MFFNTSVKKFCVILCFCVPKLLRSSAPSAWENFFCLKNVSKLTTSQAPRSLYSLPFATSTPQTTALSPIKKLKTSLWATFFCLTLPKVVTLHSLTSQRDSVRVLFRVFSRVQRTEYRVQLPSGMRSYFISHRTELVLWCPAWKLYSVLNDARLVPQGSCTL